MNDVDLRGLRIEESATPPRAPFARKVLPLTLLALSVAVALSFLWPLLRPVREVRTAPVRVHERSEGAAATAGDSTQIVAEAVGWVEADPFAHVVRPLVQGRIETLDVLEGARLVAGETVVATLDSAALRAAEERASAAVAEREAACSKARADRALAEQRLEQNSEARLRLQEARTRLAALATALARSEPQLEQARADAAAADAAKVAQERLAEAGGSYEVALERARRVAEAAHAKVRSGEDELAGLRDEHERQQQTVALCEELAEAPVDLRGAAAVAAAELERAEAALGAARTEHTIAARELGWASVRSPVHGVVLRLEAEPGDLVGPGHSGVVTVYDPASLRARIDVPLDSVAGIREGQRVEVTSEATGDVVVQGVVQRLQHESDLLKNTLQVKVGLYDPPPLLRPETLCRARFFGGGEAAADDVGDGDATATGGASSGEGGGGGARSFRVPSGAVRDGSVFVFDPARGTARRVPVEIVRSAGDDSVVRGELSPTQRVVLDAVQDGEAIALAGDEVVR